MSSSRTYDTYLSQYFSFGVGIRVIYYAETINNKKDDEDNKKDDEGITGTITDVKHVYDAFKKSRRDDIDDVIDNYGGFHKLLRDFPDSYVYSIKFDESNETMDYVGSSHLKRIPRQEKGGRRRRHTKRAAKSSRTRRRSGKRVRKTRR